MVVVRFDISISAPLISYIGASMRKYEQSMIRALEIAWCSRMLVLVDGFELTVKRTDVAVGDPLICTCWWPVIQRGGDCELSSIVICRRQQSTSH